MLGERIVEPFPAIEDVGSLQFFPEPCGLTVRRVKSAGLRIVTEGDALWPASSSQNANSLRPRSNRQSYLSVKTPDTSHTFGRPNPTMTSPKHPHRLAPSPSSSPSAVILHSRRLSRYSQVERALRSAVEVCSSELSPQELQIRALEKATVMLSDQARDAQACAAKLRARLGGTGSKPLSPSELKTLQHEYWMEERRSAARRDQSEKTRDLLTKLNSPVGEVPPPLSATPPARSMTRQEANLARFLHISPTHVDLTQSRHPPTSPTLLTRRKTISQIRPLRLRPSAMDLALRTPIHQRPRRSRSLDGTHSRRNSSSTESTFVAEDASEQTALALPLAPLKALPSPDSSRTDGFVRIEGTVFRRPRHVLLAEVGDVTIPDYAMDLIDDFAASPVSMSTVLSPVFSPESPGTVVFTSSPSTVSPFTQSQLPQSHLKAPFLGAIEDGFTRASSSMPDFSDFTLVERPSTAELGSPTGDSSLPPRPSSRSGSILDRLRSPPADSSPSTGTSSGTVTIHRRPPTANGTVRATATQSLLLPIRKLGSPRGTTPSLVTVPEAEPIERPQTSLSAYGFPSPETILEHSEADEMGKTRSKGRFAMTLFARRRFNSASSDSIASHGGSVRSRGDGEAGRPRGVLLRVRKKLSATFGSQK